MLNLFFPMRYNNYFFIKKIVIIVYITSSKISALLLEAKGYERKIMKTASFDVDFLAASSDMISSSLFKLFGHWKCDEFELIISGSSVIFKSMQTPFHDIEKIKATIPFELEPLLPFSISECALDVIFQDKIVGKDTNKVLVLVTKEEKINYFRDIFKNFDAKIDKISVDVVELITYDNLFNENKNHILLYNNTDGLVLFLFDSKGLVDLKYIEMKLDNHEALYSEANSEEIEKQFHFINQVLLSFAAMHQYALDGIIFSILGINHAHEIVKKLIDRYKFIFVEYLENKIKFNNIFIKCDTEKGDQFCVDTNNQLLRISALLLNENDYFNLAHKEAIDYRNKILFRQIVVSFVLTILIFVIQISWNLFFLLEEKAQFKRGEYKIIQVLKKEFDLSNKYAFSVDNSYKEAEKAVVAMEEGLPLIATKKKFIFLDLFSKLSKDILNDIDSLTIFEIKWQTENINSPETIMISGDVKNFNALRVLENKLKNSKLFLTVPQQQDLRFNFNLVLLKDN